METPETTPNRGQPTKLNEIVSERICYALQSGNTREASVAYGGVSYQTFLNWLERGGNYNAESAEKERLYFDFFEEVKRAEAECEVRYVKLIEKAAVTQWQAAAWWLERRKKGDYGRNERIEHSVDGPITIVYEDA